ncbi:MAG: RNA polymerase sigma-70 factor [Sphingobacterium sp.]|nr:RNA polymerase sigma-70 factor [Sphingobacterium sp.]
MVNNNTYNESELLLLVANKDEPSFNKIYNIYSDRIYAFALRILQNDVLAEEIVQDVFTKFWRYDQKEEIRNLYAWFRTLTRNQALKLLRRQAIELKAGESLARDWSEEQNNTELEINYRDIKRILDETIAQLPEQQRKVYLLCHVDGLSYEEAAKELAISKLTVQTHMKMALRNIRNTLLKGNKLLALLFFYGALR